MIGCREDINDKHPSKPFVRLEEWRIIRIREGTEHLVGIALDHPRLRPGARIVSSTILAISDTRHLAETENTLYLLGTRGEGDLPEEWRDVVDLFLRIEWGTERSR